MTTTPPGHEPTPWRPGLIGFYISCAAVGIGAGMAAIVLIVFGDAPFAGAVAVLGGALTVAGALGAWLFLRAARREG